ncbi:MAG: hypothetical protein KatS3mg111_0952 [Pirellulaceae bacterium]|nr:MAG: hypothetical protein KatS3mg111_0952 [Pirellulaceae bacterium]
MKVVLQRSSLRLAPHRDVATSRTERGIRVTFGFGTVGKQHCRRRQGYV